MNAKSEPLTIAVSNKETRQRLAAGAARRTCVLRDGARRRRRHDPPVHDGLRATISRCAASPRFRYQFPYMERGSKRPDSPKVAHATVRAAVAAASRLVPELALLAGGRSFGGRMTSQAQAASPLPGVRGLAFLGFPLHPAGQPSDERGAHLSDGARFRCCSSKGRATSSPICRCCEALAGRLGARATLELFADADHSFHVPARTGRKDADVRAEMADALAGWIATTIAAARLLDRRPSTG